MSLRLLLWPESCLEASKPALVVGWVDGETVIVAGLVPNTSVSTVARRIDEKRSASCRCCDCRVKLKCAGCTRELCLEKLQVVASFQSDQTGDLPVIEMTNGIPWWTNEADRATRGGQVLLYDPATLPLCVTEFEQFQTDILTRLAHAPDIMKALESGEKSGQPRPEQSREAAEGPRKRSPFSDYSVFMALAGVAWIQSIHGGEAGEANCCRVCGQTVALAETANERSTVAAKRLDLRLRAWIDICLGIVMGMLIFWYRADLAQICGRLYAAHYSTLDRGIRWLESFPIGFKLNERLTYVLGSKLRQFFALHGQLTHRLAIVVPISAASVALVLVGSLCGVSGLLCLTIDFIRLSTLHLQALSICFRLIYRMELHLLNSLWCLFRGKKRNVLRGRTDTMQYDSTQLLLGILIFSSTLFLFTTLSVYFVFFTATHLVVVGGLAPLLLALVLMSRFPLGRLIHRPSTTCYIEALQSDHSIDVTRLRVDPLSYPELMAESTIVPTRKLLGAFLAESLGLSKSAVALTAAQLLLKERRETGNLT